MGGGRSGTQEKPSFKLAIRVSTCVYIMTIGFQRSKFASAVGKYWGFCQGISPFCSICLGNKNAEAVKFLEILKQNIFPRSKKEIFCKRKKDFFPKKTLFLQDTNYSCASIFIIHTFISFFIDNRSF